MDNVFIDSKLKVRSEHLLAYCSFLDSVEDEGLLSRSAIIMKGIINIDDSYIDCLIDLGVYFVTLKLCYGLEKKSRR